MMTRLLLRTASILLILTTLLSCAESGPASGPVVPSEPSTYVLVRAESNDIGLHALVFHNVDTGTGFRVPLAHTCAVPNSTKCLEFLLTKPGRYYLRRLDSIYDNVASAKLEEPEALFTVLPGAISYLGDWSFTVTVKRGFEVSNVSSEFKPETLESAMALHPEIFNGRCVVLSMAGKSPVEIDSLCAGGSSAQYEEH